MNGFLNGTEVIKIGNLIRLYFAIQETIFQSRVEKEKFTKLRELGTVRATEIMNDKSPSGFQWSIKLGNSDMFYIGVASKLENRVEHIGRYDKSAILLNTRHGFIWRGNQKLKTDFKPRKIGNIVNFRFRPKLKTFIISSVRLMI